MADVTVTQLWRFPVKSMGGHRVDAMRIDRRGVHADRLWAVRDLENGVTASARRLPKLLGCSAAYVTEPTASAGPGQVPEVMITFPDGAQCSSSDPAVHQLLSELVGREVRLTALPPVRDTSEHRLSVRQSKANFSAAEVRLDFGLTDSEELPDTSVFTTKQILTLARFSTPPGTFVDLAPVHLMSSTSLVSLSEGEPYDVRRFRPNVLVDVDRPDDDFPESAWVGGDVEIGSAAMHVTIPTIRCVVPTRPQPGLDLERGLTRRLVDRTDRFLGVYADVTQPGLLRVGDTVSVRTAAPPSSARRALAAVEKAATRRVQRLLEATVLREKG
ncbi:MOSC N-terminal beta barrel domain-containing protein [Mycolicibacterium sp.]|uniref:MOSC domain-containing protein n=1 Tax=Mycolicibacterium sp. TaxID=2320850 RepID=UPI001A267100|nr:MOSC N-terminal beta barrel domain-containing protein [Mycolicibacterium sp.]MBJ7340814.1 MOSC N-terminal beta barrel domain-containing protein [Mycolicibacterium sp.]